MMLEELIGNYKDITITAINKAKNREDINEEMDKREKVISQIMNLDVDSSKVKESYNGANIIALDEELNNVIKSQLVTLKEELENSRARKKAYASYARANTSNNLYSTRV